MLTTAPTRIALAGWSVRPTASVGIGLGALSVLGLLTYPLPSAWLGLGGLVALGLARWWLLGRPFPSSPLTVPLGLYLAGAGLGLYATVRPHFAEVRFFGLLAALGAFWLTLDAVTTARVARRTVNAALLVALAATPVLLILITPTLELSRLLVLLPDRVAEWLIGHQPIALAVWEMDAIGQRYRLAQSGLGALAAYGIGLTLGPLFAPATRRARLFALISAGYLGYFLVLGGSRGALLSVALVGLLVGVLRRRRLLLVALPLLAVALGGLLHLESSVQTGHPPTQPLEHFAARATSFGSVRQRIELWENALFLLGDFSFTGVGLGLWSVISIYDAYFLPQQLPFFHTHNIFVQSYLEQGLPGLAGLLGLAGGALVVGGRTLARARDPLVRSPAISAAGAVLTLVLCGLTDVDAMTTVGMVLLFGTLGLLVALDPLAERPAEQRPLRRSAWASRSHCGRARARLGKRALVASLALGAALTTSAAAPARDSGASSPLPAGLGNPLRSAAARAYLNLGALELAKATLGDVRPPAERQRFLDAAQGYLEQALDHDPDNPSIHRTLAAVALADGQPADARDVLVNAERLAPPDDSRLFFQLGRLYRQADDVDGAIAAWSRVDRRIGAWNATGPDAQLILWGAELVRRGRWPEAVAVNREAIGAAPMNPAPYRALAIALTQDRGEAAALAAMQGLAELAPDVPWAHDEVVKLYRRFGRWQEAQPWQEQAAAAWASEGWAERERRAAADGGATIRIRGSMVSPPWPGTPEPSEMVGKVISTRSGQALLITNTLPRVTTFTVDVAYTRDDAILATATGTVHDLPPGGRRAINLRPVAPVRPDEVFTYRWNLTWSQDADGARRADTAARITLGRWEEIPGLGMDVAVSNRDTVAHSFTVQAMLLRDGQLVGLLVGTVSDLKAGSTRTTTLLANEPLPRYDQAVFAVDTMLE